MAVAFSEGMTQQATEDRPQLLRVLGFWTLMIYGVGDILGAGIYALIGEVAGIAGSLSWVSFLIATVIAGLTGISYAELGRRFPHSGGEAYFCEQAFGHPLLSFLTGWLVFCSGLVSMATVSRAFAGYFSQFLPDVSETIVVVGFVCLMAAITLVGIRISSSVNVVCTLIETSGLVLVLVAGAVWLSGSSPTTQTATTATIDPTVYDVLQAGTLAFFAFIGFEDMVKVSEEVRDPARNLPRALLTSVCVAGVLYLAVVSVATSVVSPAVLAESDAPLLAVVAAGLPNFPSGLFAVIALFAVANTGLANFVTSSRLVYGMSEQQLLPRWLGRVNARTRTPDVAIIACFGVGLTLAMWGTLGQLAGATSCLLLLVFALMNVSLIRIRKRNSEDSLPSINKLRAAIPYVAGLCSLLLLCFAPLLSLLAAAGLILFGVIAGLIQTARIRR